MLLLAALVALALAAPQEKDDAAVAVDAAEKADEAGKKSGVIVKDQTWETWLSDNTLNIVLGTLGTVFVLGGVSLASYYYYFRHYYEVKTEPIVDPYSGGYQYRDYTASAQVPGYPNQYYSTSIGRSLDSSAPSGWNVNWGQVLTMIGLAQETYEKFDFRSMDCQKKALCELTQKQEEFGETGRKISSTVSYVSKLSTGVMDAVEGLPMPSIIQTYLKEYREAINQGKNNFKPCAEVYPSCGFSVKDMLAKYQKKAAANKY